MDILRIFRIADKNFSVNIQGTYDDPLFQANQIGELLKLSNIRETIKIFDDDEKVVITTDTLGGFQKTTFLTEIGLYKLLGMSRKPIARVFQKWIFNVAKEIRITGSYELKKNIEIDKEINEKRLEYEKHNTLINSFENRRVIYLTKVKKMNNEQNIIKLGWTNEISNRNRALTSNFGASMFQDVFECKQNQQFELFLKRHVKIQCFAFRDPIIDDIKSTETYLLNPTEYASIVKIIKNNIDNYQGFNPEQHIELERIKLDSKVVDLLASSSDIQKDKIIHILSKNHISKDQISEISEISDINEIEEVSESILFNNTIPRKNTRQRKVQQYNEQLELLHTFDGLMDVLRTNPTMSMFGIKNSVEKNTIYHESRWLFIDPKADNIKYEIPITVEIHHTSIPQYIAMINKNETRIENVFSSQSQASEITGINRKQTINDSIKKKTLVKNTYYFRIFSECSEVLRNEYLSRAKLPNIAFTRGTRISQLNIKTRQIIKEFNSIADVLKEICISRASLKRACENNEAYEGFIWEYSTTII